MKKIVLTGLLGLALMVASVSFAYAAITFTTSQLKATAKATTCVLPSLTATAGQTLIVATQFNSATVTSTIASTNSDTWSQALRATSTAGSVYIFYSPNVNSGGTVATVTFSASVTSSCQEVEYANLGTGAILDVTNNSSTAVSSTAMTSGSSTTNFANELLIGSGLASSTGATFTAGASYTLKATSTIGAVEYQIVSAANSYSTTMTLGTAVGWIDTIATFIGNPVAPGTPSYSSVGPTAMSVSWASGANSTYYSLTRAPSANGTYTQITTTTSLSYADSGLTGNTSYWYKVNGVNVAGSSTYSASSTQLTLPAAPTTPTYSSIASTALTVSWTAPTGGATYYSLARATSANGTYTQVTTTTGVTYGDSGLTASSNYWYEVRGVNTTGNGSYSATSTVTTLMPTPGTPGTPSYASVGSSTFTVNWTSGTNSTYYSLARATSANGTYTQVTTTTGLTYNDSGLTGNTSYWYEVNGVNNSGNGPASASSTQLTLPAAPTTPTYSGVATSTLTVMWIAPTGGATYYSLARATSANGTYTQVTTTTGVTYGDSGLTASTNYWYEVRGVNTTGNGSYSATSTVTTNSGPPNAPSQDSPANNVQNISTTPTFLMTGTDTGGHALEYKVTIYSNGGCTSVVQTDDETASQTGWTGQNTSSSKEYTSGTQGSFTVQSALSQSTQYYWQSSAIDPEGSNTWTNSATCNGFITTSGNWTTDSGNWSISSNKLTVTPGTGNYVQLHVAGQSITNDVVEYKVSASGGSAGDTSAIFRADSGSNRYGLGDADYVDQLHRIGKTISSSYSTITSTSLTLSGSTVYDARGYANGTALQSWINGSTALSATDSALSSAGFIGIGASGNNTFTYTDFGIYTSPTITLSSLPGGGSWSVLNHSGTVINCNTGGTWNASTYNGQVPIDYDNGGGSIAVWTNGTCSGSSTATYPSSGLANDIFGGDTYTYSAGGSSTSTVPVVSASTTITISSVGLISD